MADSEQLRFNFDPQPLAEVNQMPMVDRYFLYPLEMKMLGRISSLSGRTLSAARTLGVKLSLPDTHVYGYKSGTNRVSAGLALVLFRLVDDGEFDLLSNHQVFIGEASMTRKFISQYAHPALQRSLGHTATDIVEATFSDREAEIERMRQEFTALTK